MPRVVAGIPNPQLVEVARIVAKGKPPPDWLVEGLEVFSNFIGREHVVSKQQLKARATRMLDAVNVLLKLLPLHFVFPSLLDDLKIIKKELERLSRPRPKGHNVQHRICAAVIVEAWKILHGKAQPRSGQLQQACSDYWQACGGKQIGETNDRENWRRPIERALVTDDKWVGKIMRAVQNSQ